MAEIYDPTPVFGTSKMSMGGMGDAAPSHACKISMLWNWYTIDTCFIAKSWHVHTKGGFAGSCVGVFFLVFAAQWLHRFCRELDSAMAARHRQRQARSFETSSSEDSKSNVVQSAGLGAKVNPYFYAISHKWFVSNDPNDILPTPFEHLVRSVLYMVEWGVSYMIMLLFMYYNGYIIISCILGALVGKFVFSYNEPLSCNDEEDRKCCR